MVWPQSGGDALVCAHLERRSAEHPAHHRLSPVQQKSSRKVRPPGHIFEILNNPSLSLYFFEAGSGICRNCSGRSARGVIRAMRTAPLK